MAYTSSSEQVIIKLIREVATRKYPTNNELEEALGVSRESISTRLNELERLTLIQKMYPDPTDLRKISWRLTIGGIWLAIVWYAWESFANPNIEKIAETHQEQWIFLKEYPFLVEKNIEHIVINNLWRHYPILNFYAPNFFAKTYGSLLELINIMTVPTPLIWRENMPRNYNPLEITQSQMNQAALGLLDEAVNPKQLQFLRKISENNELAAIVIDQLRNRLNRSELASILLAHIFKEGAT